MTVPLSNPASHLTPAEYQRATVIDMPIALALGDAGVATRFNWVGSTSESVRVIRLHVEGREDPVTQFSPEQFLGLHPDQVVAQVRSCLP